MTTWIRTSGAEVGQRTAYRDSQPVAECNALYGVQGCKTGVQYWPGCFCGYSGQKLRFRLAFKHPRTRRAVQFGPGIMQLEYMIQLENLPIEVAVAMMLFPWPSIN